MNYINIPILESAYRCGLNINCKANRVEVEANCPFCNEQKKHLSLNTDKNQFRCNRCNESGNSISLYAKVFHVDNGTAYRELTQENGIRIPVKKSGTYPTKQYKIKPLGSRHDIYYDLLQSLELSPNHREQLYQRGLGHETIDRNMYRSITPKKGEQYVKILATLSKTHDLSGIPGFYLENDAWRMINKKGLLIPICNEQGYIQGLQIRLDDVSNRKYRWFSSNNYNGGTKIKPWIHVSNYQGDSTVYITEGALKAEIASNLMGNVCMLGLPGVSCIDGLTELLLKLKITKVVECFDMDKLTNMQVNRALKVLKKTIQSTDIEYKSATWNPRYKGIDDFQLALRNREVSAA